MARFLTPAKVCVLALIEVYVEEGVRDEDELQLLVFVHDAVEPGGKAVSGQPIDAFAPLDAVQSRRGGGATVWERVVERVWRWESVDGLHDFFIHLDGRINGGGDLHPFPRRNFPLGQYVRRCVHEFERLQFSDSLALWTAFLAYRRPSHHVCRRISTSSRPPSPPSLHPEPDMQATAIDPLTSAPASASTSAATTATATSALGADDVEALLVSSVGRLQNPATRIPADVRAQLDQGFSHAARASPELSRDFLDFFDYWRAGQLNMAQESLQRYFDHLVTKGVGLDMDVHYPWALLHKSVLHADFQRWEDSFDAMDECIAAARENHDTVCLNLALSWLMYIRQAYPRTDRASLAILAKLLGGGNGEQDEIAFLKETAHDDEHWPLLSTTLLEEARFVLQKGGSVSKGWESILLSAYVAVQHDVRTFIPGILIFQAANYERLGQAHLSRTLHRSAALISSGTTPMADDHRRKCLIAQGLVRAGQFQRGLDILTAAGDNALGLFKLQQRQQAYNALIFLEHYLHRHLLDSADTILRQLSPFRTFGDPDIVFEIQLLKIRLLNQQEDFEAAMNLVNDEIEILNTGRGGDIASKLHLLVLKARIFALAGSPLSGFSICLRAAATAMRLSLIPTLIDALSALAHILMEGLRSFHAARDLIAAALPFALETNDLYLTAELFETLGDTYVALSAPGACRSEEEGQSNRRIAERYIERSRKAYALLSSFIGQRDCALKLAQLAAMRGDVHAKEKAERDYYDLVRQWKSASSSTLG